jgi:hypothetical protein
MSSRREAKNKIDLKIVLFLMISMYSLVFSSACEINKLLVVFGKIVAKCEKF